MGNETISEALVRQQQFAVFEHLGGGAFRLVGEPAEFWQDLSIADHTAGKPARLGDQFPFLEHFLKEAERIWAVPSAECAESGTWIEKNAGGREFALEAIALWLAGTPVLTIQNPQIKYERLVRLQQKARDSILGHERLLREVQNKEILLHCIVHDLFQPLTVMRGCFSLLSAEKKLSPSLKSMVETAEKQSERQEEMIRGILDAFSADLAAQMAIEEDPAKAPDLARCEATVVDTFKDVFAEQDVRLELDAGVDLDRTWRVRGDEPHLLRIFGNLVENSLRHSPRDSPVKLGVIDEGKFVCAFVDDEGPGLPDDQTADHLFALFARGKGKRRGKAGLGLYFCKVTVERWGGTIGCNTRPSGGARFWLRLRRA